MFILTKEISKIQNVFDIENNIFIFKTQFIPAKIYFQKHGANTELKIIILNLFI